MGCEIENGSKVSCEYKACTVEQWWLKQVSINGGFGSLINPENKHNDAGWETRQANMCVGNAVGTQRNIQCCGQFPERFPYNSLAPNKVCCTDGSGLETTVANTAFEQCCADGSVLAFGETC